MNTLELFSEMTKVYERFAQSNPHMRDRDFFEIDKAMIEFQFVPGVEFVWVLTPYGTHLSPIGLHSKSNEHARAIVQCAQAAGYSYESYLVGNRGVVGADARVCEAAARRLDYVTVGGRVCRAKESETLASVGIKVLDQNLNTEVAITSVGVAQLSLRDLVALHCIAVGEAQLAAQSLFVKIRQLSIDGSDLIDVIEHRRANLQGLNRLAA